MIPRRELERIPRPLTHMKCLKCGTINSRPFKQGDYIFKEVDERCPKCGYEKMKIIGIYVKEKEKKKR